MSAEKSEGRKMHVEYNMAMRTQMAGALIGSDASRLQLHA